MAFRTLFSVGIKTSGGKFFTVETFGDQLNAGANSLRSKQVFSLETDGQGHHAFKTHLGKYLTADHREVKANATKLEGNETFTLQFNNGLCSIQTSDGKFIAVNDVKVILVDQPGENGTFEIILNMHPQICISTQNRYIGIDDKGQVVSNKNTQFGRETLLTLEPADTRGQYTFEACNGQYLSVNDTGVVVLSPTKTPACNFTIEPQGEFFAFKSISAGLYLSPLANGLKATRPTVSAKEIFKIVNSEAQVTLKADNGKFVSFQGANLISNKTSITNEEIFILESLPNNQWALKTEKEKHVTADTSGVTVNAASRGPNELFTLEFQGSKVAFKAANGQYLSAKPLGAVALNKEITPKELFEMYFYNRPQIVLQAPQQSFVGTGQNGFINTALAKPEVIVVQYKDGQYALRNPQGKYWNTGEQGRVTTGANPEYYLFEFNNGKIAIKTSSGKYLKSENQGWLTATATSISPTELFDF